MRIAFVTPEYVTEANFDGGLSTYLGRVCPMLAAMGHDVVVFVRSDRDEVFEGEGVEIHRVAVDLSAFDWVNRLTRDRLKSAGQWLLQSRSLNCVCLNSHRQRPFDLVQYASYTGTGFFRLKSVPSVVRISSYEPMLQRAYNHPRTLDNRLRMWIEKKAISKSDATFGPSILMAEIVEREIGRPVEIIESPFLLDARDFDARLFDEQLSGKKYLLFFGSLGELKGVHLIAEIIEKLLSEEPDLYFVFAGKCFGYKGRRIIDHVWEKAGPTRSRVLYLGQLKHSQLYPVVANAHSVILPSLIDNLPNACIEAMAFKRVVVGSHGASFEQLIVNGRSGFLCENNSSASLYRVIRELLALPEGKRNEMGERAGRRVEELRPEITVAKLVDFYQKVTGVTRKS